ncbi:MAG: hypothetical protein IID61_14485 [SAR324 cluster bacterium]|nr:hypothetical protein [SAR324 cluster bacterium]
MRTLKLVTVAAGLLFLLPAGAMAVDCSELDTAAKTRQFMERARNANPLGRDRLSVYLEMSPCEEEGCSKSQRAKRIALIQNIHLLRVGDKRRAYVMEGPSSGQCVISRDIRDYICSQCDATSNIDCRSIVRDSSSGRIMGTNIDVNDFDMLIDGRSTTKCSDHPQDANFMVLEVLADKSSESEYDRIVTVFDKKKEVPITINYFAEGVLRKVYRFFPKYYVRIGDEWIATILRVRSTRGSEKQYVFETQMRVLKSNKGVPRLFVDPSRDPQLKGYDISSLFFTD